MKKIVVFIILFLLIFILGNYIITPTVDYSKIKYVSYSNVSEYGLESSEEIVIEKPNIVIAQLQLEYDKFKGQKKEYEEGVSLEEIKVDKREFKNKAKKYYDNKNKKIIEKAVVGNYQNIFVSSYSPFIDITYDLTYFNNHKIEILSNITKIKNLKNVTIFDNYQEPENCIYLASCEAGAGAVYNTRSVTGAGVSVGILESGIIDVENSELVESLIEIRDSSVNGVGPSEHTTEMAMIIGGSHGIAPDTYMYNAYLSGTMTDEMEWFLDNDVDIINMSCGVLYNLGTYDSNSAYVDYIASEYTVTIVAAAGNFGSTHNLVANPGLGYNVITVGSRKDDGGVSNFSSYAVNSGPIKPTVLTVGDTVGLRDDGQTALSGTSPAAALCTGFLALLLEAKPYLANDRERLFALMVANTVNTQYQNFIQDNGFDEYGGAGLLHYGNMIDNYANSSTYSNSRGTENSVFYQRTVYVEAGKTLRASLATIATSDGTVNGISFTDYDIYIKNSNGSILSFANSENSIIEVATYGVTVSGNYTIEIHQSSALMTSKDYIGFAYRIY